MRKGHLDVDFCYHEKHLICAWLKKATQSFRFSCFTDMISVLGKTKLMICVGMNSFLCYGIYDHSLCGGWKITMYRTVYGLEKQNLGTKFSGFVDAEHVKFCGSCIYITVYGLGGKGKS